MSRRFVVELREAQSHYQAAGQQVASLGLEVLG